MPRLEITTERPDSGSKAIRVYVLAKMEDIRIRKAGKSEIKEQDC
jgi:hypothetical protein